MSKPRSSQVLAKPASSSLVSTHIPNSMAADLRGWADPRSTVPRPRLSRPSTAGRAGATMGAMTTDRLHFGTTRDGEHPDRADEWERLRAAHLRSAAERPPSSAGGVHHQALISSDVER